MVLVEAHLTLVEFADSALDGLKLGPCRLGAGRGLIDRGGQPCHGVVDRLDPGTAGLHLTGQPGQTFPTVCLGPHSGQMRAFGLGGRALLRGEFDPRGLQCRSGTAKFGEQSTLLLSYLIGLGIERIGIRTGARSWLRLQVLLSFGGDTHRGADPLGQCREPEPGLLCGLGSRRQRGDGGFTGGELFRCRRQPCGGFVVLASQRGLDVVGTGELASTDEKVIGGQPEPGVAQVGLDGGCAPCHLGLPAQRLELTAQFGGQVAEPGQIGRGGVQFAQRLLLALAVLEHPGRLLDEGAAVLRTRLEDLRQSTLPDDDVHFPADTGVTEEFLDVHQPAAVAVDLVLAGAVAEHPSGDRHLGIVDRQQAVGVVDGQGDLGPAQRGTRGGAGENDVFHLSAAQGLGALLAHHPGQGVDDVGLTGAIRPDHAGDTGFETQSRRRREGLETLQRQTLEVHVVRAYRRGAQRSRKPDSTGVASCPGEVNSAMTVCTEPGVPPPRRSASSASQATRCPWATTSTRPSGWLLA